MKLLPATSPALVTLAVPAQATPQPVIQWGPCADQALAAGGAECGTLAVPRDPAQPNGATITLALSRVQHRTATRSPAPDPRTRCSARACRTERSSTGSASSAVTWRRASRPPPAS
ncbi:hypothetical protein [Lentzea sp. CA-135723]|uniref:hypothetical protein n=1 Tax=Lentzea sp. CA-135723 TaxID=3239950 RepID=UPI003D8AA47C